MRYRRSWSESLRVQVEWDPEISLVSYANCAVAQANFMFVVGITSHTAEELYEWECQDNAADRCMKPGWLRTERYQLSTTVPISKDMKTMKNQDDLLANRISDVLTIVSLLRRMELRSG